MKNYHGSVLVTHAEGDDPESALVSLSDPRYWHEQSCEGHHGDEPAHVAPFYATEDQYGVRLTFCQACIDEWYGQRMTSEWTFYPSQTTGTIAEALKE